MSTPIIEWSKEMDQLKAHVLDDPSMGILSKRGDDIKAIDAVTQQCRRFRLKPHTPMSILDMLYVGPSLYLSTSDRQAIATVLTSLPPEVCLNLRGIALVASLGDTDGLLAQYGNQFSLPEQLFTRDQTQLADNCLGITWPQQSVVIINVKAIRDLSEVLCPTDTLQQSIQSAMMFWLTLLHELREGQLYFTPYPLPWLPASERTTDAVNKWTQQTYSRFRVQYIISD